MATEAASDWIEWNGGECPLPSDTLVLTRRRRANGGFTEDATPETAGWWAGDGSPDASNWLHSDSTADIIAYRVVQS